MISNNGIHHIESANDSSMETRRNFLSKLLGLGAFTASTLSGCAMSLEDNVRRADSKYAFTYGPTFNQHLKSGQPGGGVDWLTSAGDTWIVPIAEGVVSFVKDHDKYPDQRTVWIRHLAGRTSSILQLKKEYVKPGQYVGRNTVIGVGGSTTHRSGGGVSPYHIHVDYLIAKILFPFLKNKGNSGTWEGGNPETVSLDSVQYLNGDGMWSGEDLFFEYETRERKIVDTLKPLVEKAPSRFRQGLDKDALFYNSDIIHRLNISLQRNAPWLTEEDKLLIRSKIEEYANIVQPLTVPFLNPKLDRIAGFYEVGSSTNRYSNFKNSYASRLSKSL